jgi:hypothetical protein
MIAYFVHDREKNQDHIVIPDRGCRLVADAERLKAFIGVKPDFAQWQGLACGDLKPTQFGTVVAHRDDQGDVCVLQADLWQARMQHYLG